MCDGKNLSLCGIRIERSERQPKLPMAAPEVVGMAEGGSTVGKTNGLLATTETE